MQCLDGDKTATEAIKCNSQPETITWEDKPDFSSFDGVL
jgi:hypothetical protein